MGWGTIAQKSEVIFEPFSAPMSPSYPFQHRLGAHIAGTAWSKER